MSVSPHEGLVQPIPLWRQLQQVARMTHAVMGGQSLTALLETVPGNLRPGVQALSFHALRHWGAARAVRVLLAAKAPSAAVDALLCSALSLLLDTEHPLYPEHTVVSQAVEAARREHKWQRQAGFINACLRRFVRERADLMAEIASSPEAVWNHPQWWVEHIQRDHPTHAAALLNMAQYAPPMTLRVNLTKTDVPTTLERLQAQGLSAKAVGACGIQLERPVPVNQLPGFAQGEVSVQDAAAQMAAPLLLGGRTEAPLRVLDACAAPGGKTGHLLEWAPHAQVLALDVDAQRAQKIEQNLQRLQVHAQVRAADAADPASWWDGQLFDAIMLDAPCSASGIVRRHPDVRWLRRASDIPKLAALQAKLLDVLWPLLKPGGRMVYCTCSVFKAEGEDNVQAFLKRNTQAVLLPSPGHLIPGQVPQGLSFGDNLLGEHDGFYYALLQKPAP
ncbi:MAG: Ribosomal small subunit methyltransferase [Pseudomonadota bacterium]|jgi:16S rRNA (cytosine967-C5)-methyltransferase